uniref:Uncharacterized protein n=1 Tax=Parascaris equorum TaxID=6256 RepID=A0A914RHZ5_PAREQ
MSPLFYHCCLFISTLFALSSNRLCLSSHLKRAQFFFRTLRRHL